MLPKLLLLELLYAYLDVSRLFGPIKPSILIVDDDLAILHCFTKIFQRKGFSVTVADKGMEAIEKLNASCYDVALLDLCLPDMEGIELLPIIQSKSPRTLKIMLTGKSWSPSTVGADVFLGKPVSPDKLLSIIETKLKGREMEL